MSKFISEARCYCTEDAPDELLSKWLKESKEFYLSVFRKDSALQKQATKLVKHFSREIIRRKKVAFNAK